MKQQELLNTENLLFLIIVLCDKHRQQGNLKITTLDLVQSTRYQLIHLNYKTTILLSKKSNLHECLIHKDKHQPTLQIPTNKTQLLPPVSISPTPTQQVFSVHPKCMLLSTEKAALKVKKNLTIWKTKSLIYFQEWKICKKICKNIIQRILLKNLLVENDMKDYF